MSPKTNIPFQNLIMQGGGIRCFWQAGFLEALSRAVSFHPRKIFSVSASAGMACAYAAGRLSFSIDCFKKAVVLNPRNFYLKNLFSRSPMFPHANMYRCLLDEVFKGDAFHRLQAGPEVSVLVARPPANVPGFVAMALGAALYLSRKYVSHNTWSRIRHGMGFTPEFLSVKECGSASEVAALILASSCTPPITPLYRLHGRVALDGGLLESVPRSALCEEDGASLILMTKVPSRISENRPGDVMVYPSVPISEQPWDYTNSAAIDAIVSLGKRDGEQFIRQYLDVVPLMSASL